MGDAMVLVGDVLCAMGFLSAIFLMYTAIATKDPGAFQSMVQCLAIGFLGLALIFAFSEPENMETDVAYEIETESGIVEVNKQDTGSSLQMSWGEWFYGQLSETEEDTETNFEIVTEESGSQIESSSEGQGNDRIIGFLAILVLAVSVGFIGYFKGRSDGTDRNDKDNVKEPDKNAVTLEDLSDHQSHKNCLADYLGVIKDKHVRDQLSEIILLDNEIRKFVKEKPKLEIPAYLDEYYLPTAEKHARIYAGLENRENLTDKEMSTCRRIEESLGKIVTAMKYLYKELRDKDAGNLCDDVESDMEVLCGLRGLPSLDADGLSGATDSLRNDYSSCNNHHEDENEENEEHFTFCDSCIWGKKENGKNVCSCPEGKYCKYRTDNGVSDLLDLSSFGTIDLSGCDG